jgi:hypothetical protein
MNESSLIIKDLSKTLINFEAQIYKLEDKVEELRDALEKIAALCPDPEFGSYSIEEAKKIAHAALNGEEYV